MKKVFIFLTILSVISFSSVFAAGTQDTVPQGTTPQDTVPLSKWKQYWQLTGIVGLNVSQAYLLNWVAGGNSNFNGIATVNLSLNYKKNRNAWNTNLLTDFGAMYSSDFKTYNWRKGNDRINFNSTYGYEISHLADLKSTWYVAVNGGFKSQYTIGYEYPDDGSRTKVSNWLSPSYTTLSVGVNWKWTDLVTLYYSPLAALITTCTDSVLRHTFGVPLDKPVMASLGMTFRAGVAYAGVKNLRIASNLVLYTPYNDPEQKFGNFNIDWDVMINYQFLKVLSVSLTTNLRYYPKVLFEEPPLRRVQFQEILGLGVAYSF
jgi:hypothetical protein